MPIFEHLPSFFKQNVKMCRFKVVELALTNWEITDDFLSVISVINVFWSFVFVLGLYLLQILQMKFYNCNPL